MSQLPESNKVPPVSPKPDEPAPEPFIINLPDDASAAGDWYLWAILLALIVLVTFCTVIPGTFLWEDAPHIAQNLALQDANGLIHAWVPPIVTPHYAPLAYSLAWAEHHIWENNATGYHVVSLVLHAIGVILLWRLLRRLKMPGAWLIAALWAVHPLQAQTVAWISRFNTVLAGALVLGSFLFYAEFAGLRQNETDRRTWSFLPGAVAYAISLILFAAAVLSTTAVAVLPFALLFVLWWKRRLNAVTGLGAIPLLGVGAAGVALATWMQSAAESTPETIPTIVGAQHIMLAGKGFWFYIAKLFVPIHQTLIYYVPSITQPGAAGWAAVLAIVLCFVIFAVLASKVGRGPLTAVACYFIALLPFLGFVPNTHFHNSFVWDYFTYMATIPIIALVVALLARILWPASQVAPEPVEPEGEVSSSLRSPQAIAVTAAGAILLFGLAVRSWFRAEVFNNPASLWSDVLDKNPDDWEANYNLGKEWRTDAEDYLSKAQHTLPTNKDGAAAYFDISKKLMDDAQDCLLKAANDPSSPPALSNEALVRLGELAFMRVQLPGENVKDCMDQAWKYSQQAIDDQQAHSSVSPDYTPYYILAMVKMREARKDEESLPSDVVDSATTRNTVVSATTRPATPAEQKVIDAYEEARTQFLTSMDIAGKQVPVDPQVIARESLQRGTADFALARISQDRGDNPAIDHYNHDAIVDLRNYVQINPRNYDAWFKLALCYAKFHHYDEAKRALIYLFKYTVEGKTYAPAYDMYAELLMDTVRFSPDLSRDREIEQLKLAVVASQQAIELVRPVPASYRRRLQQANNMLAFVRATTRATTRSTTKP